MKITIDVSDLVKGLEKDLESIREGIEDGMRQVSSEIVAMQHDIIDTRIGGDGTYVRTGLLKSSVTIMPLEWSAGLASMTITNVGCNYAP